MSPPVRGVSTETIPSAEGAGIAAETTGPRGEIVSTTSPDIVEPGNRVAPPKAQQVMRNEELALFSSWVGGHVDRGIRLREPAAPGWNGRSAECAEDRRCYPGDRCDHSAAS